MYLCPYLFAEDFKCLHNNFVIVIIIIVTVIINTTIIITSAIIIIITISIKIFYRSTSYFILIRQSNLLITESFIIIYLYLLFIHTDILDLEIITKYIKKHSPVRPVLENRILGTENPRRSRVLGVPLNTYIVILLSIMSHLLADCSRAYVFKIRIQLIL